MKSNICKKYIYAYPNFKLYFNIFEVHQDWEKEYFPMFPFKKSESFTNFELHWNSDNVFMCKKSK